MTQRISKKFAITGVGGFVGSTLAKRLLSEGYSVVGFARGEYPELEAAGVKVVRCDLSRDSALLIESLAGVEAVFHTAAKVDMWGPYREFYETNVVGTENVIKACRQAGVRYLVYTSSPSVVADGTELLGIEESYPYPDRPAAFYPATKAIAEQMVLKANGLNETEGDLFTLALRPHLIFGPGDRHLVPMILNRAKAGRLVKIGKGDNLVDFTYIDDCVEAHFRGYDALVNNPNSRGRAYFISQGEPVKMWEWIDQVLEIHGLPKVTKKVSHNLAMGLASMFEIICKINRKRFKPLFTKFLVHQMSSSHYFDISAARKELGYNPKLKIAEALETLTPKKSKMAA